MNQEGLVLVENADSVLYNDCVRVQLTHGQGIGPWTVTAMITAGLYYRVNLQGRGKKV